MRIREENCNMVLLALVASFSVAIAAQLAHLTASFRARPPIQDVVNAAFAPAMTGAGGDSQVEYVPLDGVRDGVSDQPAVRVIGAPFVPNTNPRER